MTLLTDLPRATIPCVILAGGRSRRFGSDKASATLNGRTFIEILITRLRSQTSGPIAINSSDTLLNYGPEHPILSDGITGGLGPLVGIYTALLWAKSIGSETVITVPVDTPMLPDGFVDALAALPAPTVARRGQQLHPIHAIWSIELMDTLARNIAGGLRSLQEWVVKCDAQYCDFNQAYAIDPFFNVNSQNDLSALESAIGPDPRL